MNDRIKDGGPAFPRAGYEGEVTGSAPEDGMTLRDWFAGQALAGVLAGYCGNPKMSGLGPEQIAGIALEAADAMLSARSGGAAR